MISRISIDPTVCHGKPVIQKTRVLVSNILSSLAAGESTENIVENFPSITKEDVAAALEFGSQLASFESFPYEEAS